MRDRGHDVFALDEHSDLEGLDDEGLLAIAAKDGRVLVTHNVHDFPDILRSWAEADRRHAGCLILVGMQLHEFGGLITCINAALAQIQEQESWTNRSVQMGRVGF
jgi:hypothetical protein